MVLLAVALAAVSAAQTKAVLGRDNAEFARALLDAGYDDLAEGLTRAIVDASGGANFGDEFAIKMLALEIRQVRAAHEPDALKRKDLIVSVIEDKRNFLADYNRIAEPVRESLPGAYFVFGDALAKALSVERDPLRAATLRHEGQTEFAAAEEMLRQRADYFHENMDNPAANNAYATRQYASALYALSVIYYFHALIYPEDDPERERVLKLSLDGFLDFGLDFQDDLLSYCGMVFQGLCHRALGRDEHALRDFDDAIALRKTYGEPVKGVFESVPPDAVDVISWAVQEKVRLFAEQGEHDRALAAARDYFATLPTPLLADRGFAVLLGQARAALVLGDRALARTSAQELNARDAAGSYGSRARVVLGELIEEWSGSLSPLDVLAVAETLADCGSHERALLACRQAREQARGTPQADEIAARSHILEGRIFMRLGRLHEASIALDLAIDTGLPSAFMPDALWSAVQVYEQLYAQERNKFYARRASDHLATLAMRYPNHPNAVHAALVQARQLEGAGEFKKAVELYESVQPSSAGYAQAQLSAGKALCHCALGLADSGDMQAVQAFDAADRQLHAALSVIDKTIQSTLDGAVVADMQQLALETYRTLGELWLNRRRAKELEELLTDAELNRHYLSGDWPELNELRALAWIQLGKLDAVMQMLEAPEFGDPSNPNAARIAAALARELDKKCVGEHDLTRASKRVDSRWISAVGYYVRGVRPQLDGVAPLNEAEVLTVAMRLFAIGMQLNEVPVNCDSFVDWLSTPCIPDAWESAEKLLRALWKLAPSTRVEVRLARVLGSLGKITEANEIYSAIFLRNKLILPNGKLDVAILNTSPELFDAYLEWGVTEHLLGWSSANRERLDRAAAIFARMVDDSEPGSRRWWRAKFYQVVSLDCDGQSQQALRVLNDAKRTQSPRYDDDVYGLQQRFGSIEREIQRKCKRR